MSGSAFRVGAARLLLEPPLGLPMAGFVRQRSAATGYGRYPLETTAIALERGDVRVILCGVDIVDMDEPDISRLITDVATATGAEASGVLINWNHTHLAPIGGFWGGQVVGPPDDDRDRRIGAFADVIQQKVVSVCTLAVERLEPARPVWGIGTVDLAVNRRERSASGETILGWNPDELVDNSVTTVQFRRGDESVLATLVAFGCHPVTTGYEMTVYSADYPGAIRKTVRDVDGGECVFFQGAGGNVLPRIAFTDGETEAARMGIRIGLEAIRSVADRFTVPQRMVRHEDGSVMSISKYKREGLPTPEPALEATHERVQFPLLPHPSPEEVAAVSSEWEPRLEQAAELGDIGQVRIAWYHVS